jgi:hypothetical protein
MAPGPRPRPSAMKLLRGERRPSRVNRREPQAPLGVGPAPEHLSPAAQQVREGSAARSSAPAS